MKISVLKRHQLIENLTAQDTDGVVIAVARLWETMAAQIILVVGVKAGSIHFTLELYPLFD